MTASPTLSKRTFQLAEDIRGVVANLFATGKIRDPRLQGITIHYVKLTPDLRIAKVYYITPDGIEKETAEQLLKPISGYVRKLLGEHLSLRYISEIHFYYDDNIDHAIKINELLSKL